jgi:hypothetical protein
MTPLRLRLTLSAVVAALVAVALAVTAPSAPGSGAGSVRVSWSETDVVGTIGTATTTSTLYKFSSYVAGKPVRWNPCATIHWKFRTVGGPPYGVTVARQAVARVAQLTGTRWVEDSGTTATPNSAWLPKSTLNIKPVLIGWTDGSHSDLLRNQPASVLGVTRTAYFGTTIDGVSLAATKAAVIALDRTDKLPLYGALSWKTTLLHELGHAMGLDHVGSTSQLMYPSLSRTLTDLQSGDRTGLSRLGISAGCINLGF